jgi:hypothetical protein
MPVSTLRPGFRELVVDEKYYTFALQNKYGDVTHNTMKRPAYEKYQVKEGRWGCEVRTVAELESRDYVSVFVDRLYSGIIGEGFLRPFYYLGEADD